jgi:hypothetical protein
MRSAVSPFIIGDAIVGLAQRLTEALNQLASGSRRTNDLIEELSPVEEFRLDLADGSNSRTARSVLHDPHFPDKLPVSDPAEQDDVSVEFSNHVDSTAE